MACFAVFLDAGVCKQRASMAMCCTASTTAWSISATEGAVPVALAGGDGLVLMAQASPPPTATKKTKKKGEKKKKKEEEKKKRESTRW